MELSGWLSRSAAWFIRLDRFARERLLATRPCGARDPCTAYAFTLLRMRVHHLLAQYRTCMDRYICISCNGNVTIVVIVYCEWKYNNFPTTKSKNEQKILKFNSVIGILMTKMARKTDSEKVSLKSYRYGIHITARPVERDRISNK